jgi:Uma2 family endonuclease
MLVAMDVPMPHNIRGLRTDEFMRLVELGVFDDQRVELLEGQLVEMSAQSPAHSALTAWLARMLGRHLPESMDIRQHSSFIANDRSLPEPDISIGPFEKGYHHPSAGTAVLVVEVAHSSIYNDRNVKLRIYGRAGVREYWIVDVNAERIEVYRQPTANGYDQQLIVKRGEVIAPLALPEAVIDLDILFEH